MPCIRHRYITTLRLCSCLSQHYLWLSVYYLSAHCRYTGKAVLPPACRCEPEMLGCNFAKTTIENFSCETMNRGFSLRVDYVISLFAIGILSSRCDFQSRSRNQRTASPCATGGLPRLPFLESSSDLNHAI